MTQYQKDLAERVFWTFIQAFLGTLVIAVMGAFPKNWDDLKSLAISAGVAGVAAVFALVKGLIATKIGDPNSAAILSTAA